MSGSGGGGGGGFFDGNSTPCERLIFDAQLSSPKEAVVALLQEQDILPIEMLSIGTTSVVAVLYKDQIAGGIASPAVQRLRQCMTEGYKFKALVISKNDGQVRLRVSGA